MLRRCDQGRGRGPHRAEKNRVEKLLEDAQIKLSVVACDIFRVSGRDMMAALLAGQTNPQVRAQLARTGMWCRDLGPPPGEALVGSFIDYHRFPLARVIIAVIGARM